MGKKEKMESSKVANVYTVKVSESFESNGKLGVYEPSFRRWLVRELVECRMSPGEAVKRFNFNPVSGFKLLSDWRKKYGTSMVLALPEMNEKDKSDLLLAQSRVAALEKQIEDLQMQVIARDTLIDVAEELLNIDIRKKPGAKQ